MPERKPFAIAFILLLVGNGAAQASDAELQAALRKAKCGSPTVKQKYQQGDVTVFEANCFRSSHRVITVTCVKSLCHVEEPEADRGKD